MDAPDEVTLPGWWQCTLHDPPCIFQLKVSSALLKEKARKGGLDEKAVSTRESLEAFVEPAFLHLVKPTNLHEGFFLPSLGFERDPAELSEFFRQKRTVVSIKEQLRWFNENAGRKVFKKKRFVKKAGLR